ncbi:MAG TPA: 50S ribosomal protein L30 [Bacillota bacterium]|jgi:large subunit ribosomal protein L30|nr:50S ribosomal protein L30 [Bacillota bacterium]HOL08980.1 50S ribosomal protein L30 [Bacillota bacterium]HPO96466.1 50S ribosomal protein L30 [Bacillota bacterium]
MPRKKSQTENKTLTITLKHSAIGRSQVQKDTLKALGFKKLNQTISKVDNPAIRGMIKTVEHLVEVKEEA